MSETNTITSDTLEKLTGLTDRHIRRIAKSGYFPNPKDGKYQFTATITGLFKYYREQNNAGVQDLKKEKLAKDIALREKDIRLRESQIQEAEMSLAISRNEYVSEKIIAEKALGIFEQCKASLTFSFIDRAPSINDGLPAQQQRTNNKQLLNDALRGLADWANKMSKG